jgi:hypothetical protein
MVKKQKRSKKLRAQSSVEKILTFDTNTKTEEV